MSPESAKWFLEKDCSINKMHSAREPGALALGRRIGPAGASLARGHGQG
jgi:hypothetical protein